MDLDDDNDGILDNQETSCTTSLLNKTGVVVSVPASLNYSYNANTIANMVDGVDANIYVLNGQYIGTVNNSPLLNISFPTAKALVYLEVGHFSGQSLFSTASTYKIQGSLDNTNWTDVSGTLTYNNLATSATGGLSTVNSNIANFPTNRNAYQYYRIFAITASGGTGWATELYFKENICVDINTDGDATPNRLDLDSDGDGCPDAVEAGTTAIPTSGILAAAKLTASVIPAPYGANGFANGLETSTESGAFAGTYTYSFATDANTSGCLDSDGDGTSDINDLDDDNDGVLDIIEDNCSVIVVNKTGAIITKPSTINYSFNGNTIANLIDGVDNNVYVINGPSGTLNGPWLNFEFPSPKALTYLEIGHYSGQYLFSTASTYKIQGSTDNTNWTDVTGTLTYNNIATSTSGGLSNNNSNIANFPTNTTAYKYYRILGINASAGAGWATEIYFKEFVCGIADLDGDGIPNRLDLDSDGDGCADAIEASSSKTAKSITAYPTGTDTNGNGLLNVYESATAGVISYTSTYSNYALDNTKNYCTDTDNDGVPDLIDLDDDNDGVLDISECSEALMIENTPGNLGKVSRKSWTLTGYDEAAVNSYAGTSFGAVRAEATQIVYGEVKLPPATTTAIQEPITTLDFPSLDLGTVVYREVFVKIPSTTAFTSASQINFRIG
jgi:hypothetical protein